MDATGVASELEAALTNQLILTADNPAMVAAGEILLAALRPAIDRVVLQLAEQAAVEVGAQLPDYEVEVVLAAGEPTLRLRPIDPDVWVPSDDFEARLTLRLPQVLKRELEEAAGTAGDSINTYVVKALAGRGRTRRRTGQRISGTFQT